MNRRSFIKHSSVAGVSATTLTAAACSTPKETPKEKEPGVFTDDFDLNEATIGDLQKKMQAGQYTSAALTQLYLDRIQAIDKNGPGLNSVIEVNPDALSIAKAMDQERKDGKVRGPMHGIPVLIKDNINTADKRKAM